MKAWGLVHSKSLTVPATVTCLVWSNMAKEWWAKATPPGAEMSAAAARPQSEASLMGPEDMGFLP